MSCFIGEFRKYRVPPPPKWEEAEEEGGGGVGVVFFLYFLVFYLLVISSCLELRIFFFWFWFWFFFFFFFFCVWSSAQNDAFWQKNNNNLPPSKKKKSRITPFAYTICVREQVLLEGGGLRSGGGGGTSILKVTGTCRWTGYNFAVINIGTGYLNRLLADYSVYHRVASQGFPAGFPAHNVYDRPAISDDTQQNRVRPYQYRVCIWKFFSKVYCDRVYFLCAERFETGSGFQPPSGTPVQLRDECPRGAEASSKNMVAGCGSGILYWAARKKKVFPIQQCYWWVCARLL